MQAKYGAQFSTNDITPIAEYIAINYGTETNLPPNAPLQVATATTPAQAPTMSVVKMATVYGCLSCHKEDVKVVGPAYKDVRAKYLHDPDAIAKICYQIKHGGTGKWGSAIMPPFTAVSDADAQRLAEWIMTGSDSK